MKMVTYLIKSFFLITKLVKLGKIHRDFTFMFQYNEEKHPIINQTIGVEQNEMVNKNAA